MVAQTRQDVAPLKNWPAPLYWQPTAEEHSLAAKNEISGNAAEVTPLAQTPVSSLVFVGMTPCRLVDTRSAAGFTGAFGPPSLVAGATRSFPLQASTTCSIPSIAQAYSLNITVVPPGYLGFLTIWPYGAARPSASTLNDYLGTVVANAAIVPAGNDTSGSVDVFVNDPTDLIIDINGYYAPQSGITLTQGTAAAPSLSFAGDAGTGIYSSGTGTVNIATGGTNSLVVQPNGNVEVAGTMTASSFGIGGNLFAFGSYSAANAFLGFSGNATTTGINNTANGYQALQANTTGGLNTATGFAALYNNTTGYQSTAAGFQALYSNTTGSYNTASGSWALYSNTTGSNNTASGLGALKTNTTGNYNTASGFYALYANTTGYANTASGFYALSSNTTGYANTADGYEALFSNTTGINNVASGWEALYANTTGYANTANGVQALASNTTGYLNTASGVTALYHNTTGYENTAVGEQALASNTTGSGLTCIGFLCTAGDAISNATAIGAHAVVAQSNSVVLGGTGPYAVKVGIGTTTPSNILTIARGAGHPLSDSWETFSSRRWKTNVHTLDGALAKVEQLRGVSYDLKANGKHEVGVIAEEVGAVVPEVVTWEQNGQDAQSVDYGRLTALLIEATKEQQALIRKQQAQIELQQMQINAQQMQIRGERKRGDAQQARIARLVSQVKEIQAVQASLKTNSGADTQVRTAALRVPTDSR